MRTELHDSETAATTVEPFTVAVPTTCDDLRRRLDRTRWIDEMGKGGWEFGLSVEYMKELVAYWRADTTGAPRSAI